MDSLFWPNYSGLEVVMMISGGVLIVLGLGALVVGIIGDWWRGRRDG